ncbi:MAG: trigger factor [Candidatus Pacebacteria bacterium]|nr:trigger factor [Candidatus Paceibacterota bacterium]
MKTEIKKLKQANIEIDCQMEWQEFFPYYEKTLSEVANKAEIKGFRAGKAPKDLVEKEIGKHKILQEAVEDAIKETYFEAIRKNKLEPIGPPQVEILKLAEGNPLEFRIKAQVLPEVNLPDYQKIVSKVAKKKSQVEDEEVEETIKWIQKSRANMEETEGPAKKGNWVEIEYQTPLEVRPLTGQSPAIIENGKWFQDAFILGEAKLLPGFEAELEGMKKGEEKEFSAEFPKDYFNKDLADKKADFKVKMKAVKIIDIPELTDDFAKAVGKFENIIALKQNVKEGLAQEKEIQAKENWKDEVLKAISEKIEFEMPDVLVLSEKERIMEGLRHEAEHLKIGLEDYLKRIQRTLEDLEKEAEERARQRVKNYLILKEVGKKEGIEILEEEIEKEINRILASYPQTNPQEIDKEAIKGVLYNNRVFEALEKFCDK